MMKVFFLGAWLAAAVLIGVGWTTTGSPSVGMCVWFGATFAGWAVLALAGKDGRGA